MPFWKNCVVKSRKMEIVAVEFVKAAVVMISVILQGEFKMQQNIQTNIEANIKLDAIESQLKHINKNLLNVFWIVGFFAFLYFGLMIYLLFFR